MPEGSVVISQEDIDNHNKEGGAWVIIHGKVYDVQSLSTQVRTRRTVAQTSVGGKGLECPCQAVAIETYQKFSLACDTNLVST